VVPLGKGDYCGAQKLAEALLGWDLLGFHPKSAWKSSGLDKNDGVESYDPDRVRGDVTLHERRGPYLELGSANAYRVGISAAGRKDGLYDNPAPLWWNTYVICDAFGVKRITLTLPNNQTERFLAGTPILYYKANTLYKTISNPSLSKRIYDVRDNVPFTTILPIVDKVIEGKKHKLGFATGTYQNFYEYIADPKASTPGMPWPYRPDSYILISAGADGEYGTADDITNF